MLIVKLSGKALNDSQALGALFEELKTHNEQAIIVHGGGVEVDKILGAFDLQSSKIEGIRVSPSEHMPYITAALAGQCNKVLQSHAIAHGLNAVGLLCTDFNLCALTPYEAKFGQVASCSVKDSTLVKSLLNEGVTPVICSIGINEQGQLYNINADEVAAAIAIAFKAPLVFFSDVKGVLDQNGQVIELIDSKNIEELIATKVITDGMAVKVKNALAVAKQSNNRVFIASIFDEQARLNLSKLRRIGTSVQV